MGGTQRAQRRVDFVARLCCRNACWAAKREGWCGWSGLPAWGVAEPQGLAPGGAICCEVVPRPPIDVEVVERCTNAAAICHGRGAAWARVWDPGREHAAWQALVSHAPDMPNPAQLPTRDVDVNRVQAQPPRSSAVVEPVVIPRRVCLRDTRHIARTQRRA